MEPAIEPPSTLLKLSCSACGAEQTYSADEQSLRCRYCASVTPIAPPAAAPAPVPVAEQAIVPLSVSEKALLDAVYEHLASGTLTPDDLLERATFVRKDRWYAPTFEYTGSYEAKWTASFGYDRTEHYTEYESRTENGRTRQVPVTKTRTVTDWRPAHGHDEGRFTVRAYAGQRVGHEQAAVLALLEDAGASQAEPFDVRYTVGVEQETATASPDAAYETRGRAHVHARIDAGVQRHAQGDRQRDWHWTANIRKQHRAVWVPLCHVVYEYQGQRRNVWASGLDAERMVADALPVDRARIKTLAWGLAPLGLALVSSSWALKALQDMEEKSVWPGLTLVAAGAFAVWRWVAIVGHSTQRRQAWLAARRGEPAALGGAPSAASRMAMLAPQRALWVAACVLGAVLPAVPMMHMPQWRSEPEPRAAAPAPWPQRPTQPAPPPVRRAVPAPPPAVLEKAPSAEPANAAPNSVRSPEQAIAAVLVAASRKDWARVDAEVARMKAAAPAHTASEIDTLNNQAREWLRKDNTRKAAEVLTQVVVLAPERPSAWAPLTEGLSNNEAGLNALRVAVHLSTDRAKTVVYLQDAKDHSASDNFAALAAVVLREIDHIPRHPKDTSAAPSGNTPSR